MYFLKKAFPAIVLATMGFNDPVSAALETRPGGMVYDTDYNITWLADGNFAQTSGNAGGDLFSFAAAVAWTDNLVYGGYSDWRLPTALNPNGTGPCGPGSNCTGSELGHLFYTEIGAVADQSILSGNAAELAKFSNIQSSVYWSGTEVPTDPNFAAYFNTSNGFQNAADKNVQYFVWPVRNGDVVVPIPAAIWLFGSAVAGLIGFGRRVG